MKNAGSQNHWGLWVEQRASFLGFVRKFDLAVAVGCATESISKWVTLPTHPTRMQKGFDAALIRALQTDRAMLFRLYKTTSAEDAPIVQVLEKSAMETTVAA